MGQEENTGHMREGECPCSLSPDCPSLRSLSQSTYCARKVDGSQSDADTLHERANRNRLRGNVFLNDRIDHR